MRKLKAYWASLSRAVRILLMLLLLGFIGLCTYITFGSPPLTPEIGFRRAEKAHMIGPSQILETFTLTPPKKSSLLGTPQYDETVFVAQTQDLDILYNYTLDTFHAYPRSQYPAIYTLSETPTDTGPGITPLHLILFDRNSLADRADIEFKVIVPRNTTYNDEYLILESAFREHDGFFYFPIFPTKVGQDDAFRKLQKSCIYGKAGDVTEITVTLYDKDGQPLSRQTILPGPSIA